MSDVPAALTWPVVLRQGELVLRPLRRSDAKAWRVVRDRNYAWLAPWEPSKPTPEAASTFRQMVTRLGREARTGRMLPLAIEVNGEFAGQISLFAIVWGSMRSGQVGYWIDEKYAGRGLVPLALALLGDHAFEQMGLHRLEVNIRPDNLASLRVVNKLGFRYEGLRRGYLHIDGRWRDHASYALVRTDVPERLITRWRLGGESDAAADPVKSHQSHESQQTHQRHTLHGA